METTSPSNDKVREALELLREAAAEKKDEIRSMIRDQYGDLAGLIGGWSSNVKGRAQSAAECVANAAKMGKEKASYAALAVDESVHARPWQFIGGAAVAALLLGFMLGKRGNHNHTC